MSALVFRSRTVNAFIASAAFLPAMASEHLLGYTHGAEPLPKGATELDALLTYRFDKGEGTYNALDAVLDLEHGLTDRFTAGIGVRGLMVDTSDLIINGYLPEEQQLDFQPSGVEAEAKYNISSAAKDGLGVTVEFEVEYGWIDPHSGQDKNTLSFEYGLALQSYFLDGQLIWMLNGSIENTIATRQEIEGLDPSVEWSTDPEVEIEFKGGTGLSYRFVPNWFIGAEVLYETEYETEVGQERWSFFGGPSLHYASQSIWVTLTWLPQLWGGGEKYDGQKEDLHLIEKTKQEIRLRAGYTF